MHVCVEWSSPGHHVVWWFVDIDLLLTEAVLMQNQVTAKRYEVASDATESVAIADTSPEGF